MVSLDPFSNCFDEVIVICFLKNKLPILIKRFVISLMQFDFDYESSVWLHV